MALIINTITLCDNFIYNGKESHLNRGTLEFVDIPEEIVIKVSEH